MCLCELYALCLLGYGGLHRGQEKVSNLLELESQEVLNPPTVGVGN